MGKQGKHILNSEAVGAITVSNSFSCEL